MLHWKTSVRIAGARRRVWPLGALHILAVSAATSIVKRDPSTRPTPRAPSAPRDSGWRGLSASPSASRWPASKVSASLRFAASSRWLASRPQPVAAAAATKAAAIMSMTTSRRQTQRCPHKPASAVASAHAAATTSSSSCFSECRSLLGDCVLDEDVAVRGERRGHPRTAARWRTRRARELVHVTFAASVIRVHLWPTPATGPSRPRCSRAAPQQLLGEQPEDLFRSAPAARDGDLRSRLGCRSSSALAPARSQQPVGHRAGDARGGGQPDQHRGGPSSTRASRSAGCSARTVWWCRCRASSGEEDALLLANVFMSSAFMWYGTVWWVLVLGRISRRRGGGRRADGGGLVHDRDLADRHPRLGRRVLAGGDRDRHRVRQLPDAAVVPHLRLDGEVAVHLPRAEPLLALPARRAAVVPRVAVVPDQGEGLVDDARDAARAPPRALGGGAPLQPAAGGAGGRQGGRRHVDHWSS